MKIELKCKVENQTIILVGFMFCLTDIEFVPVDKNEQTAYVGQVGLCFEAGQLV